MKYSLLLFALLVVVATVKGQDEVCSGCEVAARVVELFVEFEGYNSTQIENEIQSGCNLVPAFYQECIAVSELYLDEIIQEITAGVAPQQVCQGLDLCPASKGSPNISKVIMKINKFSKMGKH
eukprot:TRINITY_DN659_c0_g1_i1.p1 TRINITY_DN659_c0_g1~~TRINITY_DN659_c0_g1_i1.p1  ORF type:complete len:123 (-),score=43.87 TRINITY_DN659_c0_g1_i1:39-407(-)